VPYKGITLSRHNVMKRDNFRVLRLSKNLTLDHVIPE
jgi:hypothetical protein